MSAITSTPTNKNFLSPLGFVFTIKKTPHVNYFVQSVTVPELTLGTVDVPTPFSKLPLAGDHINFGNLDLTFRLDEDMKNYIELYNWITAIGFPDTFDQYKEVANSRGRFQGNVTNPTSGAGAYSDASLIILNSVKAPIIEIVFTELYPISLSQITFDTKMTDVDYLDCTCTFSYRSFKLKSI